MGVGAILLVVGVPMLIYALNGLAQFDSWFGQLARLSAEGQQKYDQWQSLEMFSVVIVLCGVICLGYGMAAKNEIKPTNYNQA